MNIITQFYAEVAECLNKYGNQEITVVLKKKITKEVLSISKKYAISHPHLFDNDSVVYSMEGATISINPSGLLEENLKQGIIE